MKPIASILLLCLLFLGCTKNTDYITISGYLYQDCAQAPIVNYYVELYQTSVGNVQGGHVAGSDTTDVNGFFAIRIPSESVDRLILREGAGGGLYDVMYEIRGDKNIENLKVYINPSSILQVYLNVINPRSSSDTLVIANFDTMQDMKVIGPFSSGVLYTAANYQPLGMYFNGEDKSLLWYFNTYHGTYFEKYFNINKYCVNDTIRIVADIQ